MIHDLSQTIHGKIIFSVYSVKRCFLFLKIWYYLSVKKAKLIISQKVTLDDISSNIEKDDVHPRKYGIYSDRKNKDDKKVYFYKKVPVILCAVMETFVGVSIYCFSMNKKQRNLIYRAEI